MTMVSLSSPRHLSAWILTAFLMAVTGLATTTPTPAWASGSADVIRQLGDQTVSALADKNQSKAQQVDAMRSVFRNYFAVESIGRFVLSRAWRKMTSDQRTEYLNLFEDLIVYGYANRFGGYAGEKLEILGARDERNGTETVLSRVVSPDGKTNIEINWLVENVNGRSQITDVVVEGVSLKLTQRSDFTAALKQQGGDVNGLLSLLRQKVDTLKTQAGQ